MFHFCNILQMWIDYQNTCCHLLVIETTTQGNNKMNLQDQLDKENLHILTGNPEKNEVIYATKEKITDGIKPMGVEVYIFFPKNGGWEKL